MKVPPDYPSDLNAMHEAEKVLTREQRGIYGHLLWDALHDERDYEHAPYWFLIHATAAQRAEAFLRTLNLWK